MRTIAIINQKGGCGKTTTSVNLAACLARLGQKTLLVDMDPQGHCGVGLAVPEDQIERTIYDTLIEPSDGRPSKVADVVWQIATDFDLAPSDIKLAAFEQVFAGRPGREDRLAKALASVQSSYEWCVIDCPPSVGLITFNALKAADEVVVPVETGYFSLHGLTKMMETLEMLREQSGRELQIRVLPTLYDTRTKLAREVLSELRAKFRDYLMESAVNFNTKLKEAASFGQPITEYDPGSRGYKDFVNLARELMGHRPTEAEPTVAETLSRPAELVQRAKQLSQLANFQFGRLTNTSTTAAGTAPITAAPASVADETPRRKSLFSQEPSRGTGDIFERAASLRLEAEAPVLDLSIGSGMSDPHYAGGGTAVASLASVVAPESAAGSTAGSTAGSIGIVSPVARKTTDQKLEDFYGVEQVGDEVRFAARFEGAHKVLIAGDFNNWSPVSTPMVLGERPGLWMTRLPLNPGRYRYRFVVDGRWLTDPHNGHVESNQFGELNNVVEVG